MAYDTESHTTTDTHTLTATVNSGSNRMALIAFTGESSQATWTSPTATIGGNSLTLLGVVDGTIYDGGSDYAHVAVFYANESLLTTVGIGSKTVTLTGGTNTPGYGRTVWYVQFSGRSQSAPTYAGNGSQTASMTASVSVSASASAADIFGVFTANSPLSSITQTGDLGTLIATQAPGGDCSTSAGYGTNLATSGSKTASFSFGSAREPAIAGVILEATGGATTAPITTTRIRNLPVFGTARQRFA